MALQSPSLGLLNSTTNAVFRVPSAKYNTLSARLSAATSHKPEVHTVSTSETAAFNRAVVHPSQHLHQPAVNSRRSSLVNELSCTKGSLQTVHELTAVVTVVRKRHPSPQEKLLDQIDSLSDLAGRKIVLQLVSSSEVDPTTGAGKRSAESALQQWSEKATISADKVQYTSNFTVHTSFGVPGAITIINHHQNEFFVETIALQGLPSGTVYFPCYSWVQPYYRYPRETAFFSNQVYLPQETPTGLRDLREKEKDSFRGNGRGTRKPWERIYDYDVYNDVGNPDKSKDLSRQTLGESGQFPYPRRCRTGRPRTKADSKSEMPLEMGTSYYVPRDEAFQQVKQETFIGNSLKGVIHKLVPSVSNSFREEHDEFHSFHDIDKLYQEGVKLRRKIETPYSDVPLPSCIVDKLQDSVDQVSNLIHFPKPDILSKDRFAWLRDDEFGRQALAGANPVHIQRVQEFPLKSKLDPAIFGCPISAIKEEHLSCRLEGLSVEQAIEQKRLFVLDYHDVLMPFVGEVNKMEGRKMYASRTLLFLNKAGTVVPVAIELCLPPRCKGGAARKRVFTPGAQDGEAFWKWQLAKAHASSNDAGFHQLVNHWLRSHAVVEPYIIASHRQLSKLHPVFKLLEPHLRYTLEINASARQLLINAGGIIEDCFTPGPLCLPISSHAYARMWRFDHESLPADLINRGMAIKDETQPNGLKLVLDDYPYADDGLLLWNTIEEWVDEYISLYYKNHKSIKDDMEIQEWWHEIRTQGHKDKQNEKWWPNLNTLEDLKNILTTIIWTTSGFHAAVNFGQYAYGGFVPNRPCLTRRLIPEDGTLEALELTSNPEKFFMSTIPNRLQTVTAMSILDTLSSHSPDEEYLGERKQTRWTIDVRAIEACNRFSSCIKKTCMIIAKRNTDPKLKHRCGVGVLPYELLVPISQDGREVRGVPNSISI